MHANLLAQSDNISGEELRAKGTIAVTIASIRVDEMEKIGKPGSKTLRGVVTFRESGAKPWILNKTNVEILKVVFGEGRCGKQGSDKEHADGKCYQTDHWIGQRIALGATKQKVAKETVDGIVVVGADAVSAPLEVLVALRSKAARTYTVHPPKSKAAPAPEVSQ